MKWSVAFSFYHINLKQKNNVQKIIQVKNIDIRFHCFILLTDIYCLIRWMSRIFNNSCFYRSNERNWCKYLHVSRQKTNRKCPSVLQLLLLLLHWKKWKKMVLLLSSYWPHTAIVTVFFSFTCFLLSKHTNTTKVGKINNYMEKKKSKKNIFSSFNKNQQRTVKILKKIKKGFFFVSLISFYKDIN